MGYMTKLEEIRIKTGGKCQVCGYPDNLIASIDNIMICKYCLSVMLCRLNMPRNREYKYIRVIQE